MKIAKPCTVSPAKNVYACSAKNDMWSIAGNVIGSEAKKPAKCCSDERSDGSFFLAVTALQFFCHCKRLKIILVNVLTEVRSLENIASWNWRQIALAGSDSVSLTLRSLVCMWKDMPKRWVIITLFVYCMFHATRGTKSNYIVVEEKLLGFVLAYKLACTELNGSDSFVKWLYPVFVS